MFISFSVLEAENWEKEREPEIDVTGSTHPVLITLRSLAVLEGARTIRSVKAARSLGDQIYLIKPLPKLRKLVLVRSPVDRVTVSLCVHRSIFAVSIETSV